MSRRLLALALLAGLLPVLPMLVTGSPVLNNDMLVAYFCYFWDFHRNWSWDSPLVFWSSSYQTGMPMFAYWQSGFLYPVTWVLFGPLSPHIGIHLFYAFHFFLGILGFLKLGPRLGLHRPASLWAGLAFALSGTMLARYEHATFLSGWAWLPLVLNAFLALRDAPGPRNLLLYALAVCLQAFGGHPQASATTAVLIGLFSVAALFRGRGRAWTGIASSTQVTGPAPAAPKDLPGAPTREPPPPRVGRLGWIFAGHLLALVYCLPLVLPFLELVSRTDRFDGVAWEQGAAPADPEGAAYRDRDQDRSAAAKLEAGVFDFRKFSTGGMRPLHLSSLFAAHALGTPSNASWWGGEAWGEVFVYFGVLGLFFCAFASWKRAGRDLRLVWVVGLVGLWFAFGAHLGASQILYEVPGFNNFRRPARYLILFAFAFATLSAHGYQLWSGKPRDRRVLLLLGTAGLLGAALCLALRLFPEAQAALVDSIRAVKRLDPDKDHAAKISALAGRLAWDGFFTTLSAGALWFAAAAGSRRARPRPQGFRRPAHILLFAVLLLDLLRIHWDHFYLFPSTFYREPPRSAAVLDRGSSAFWRVSHYLEYPGLEMWRMHNDPLSALPLFEREKEALSHGIHAVFGYRHVGAHLPLVWHWDEGLGIGIGGKSARYLFSNRDLDRHGSDSLAFLGRFGEVRAYEVKAWRPRLELLPARGLESSRGVPGLPSPEDSPREVTAAPKAAGAASCPTDRSAHAGLCVQEIRDGRLVVWGDFGAGDTLVFREHAYPGWRYRVDEGPWTEAPETREHFLAAPLGKAAGRIEFAYVPREFYRWTGVSLVITVPLAVFAVFRRRRKLSMARPDPPG